MHEIYLGIFKRGVPIKVIHVRILWICSLLTCDMKSHVWQNVASLATFLYVCTYFENQRPFCLTFDVTRHQQQQHTQMNKT
jgi:hypothetical protein